MRAHTVQRDQFDAALLRMVNDEVEDGTPVLDPNRDYEDEYHHLSAQHNASTRSTPSTWIDRQGLTSGQLNRQPTWL